MKILETTLPFSGYFNYKCDWVQKYSEILENNQQDKVKIKGAIIESNQDINQFVQRLKQKYPSYSFEYKKSKEKDFHNLIIKSKSNVLYFYIDTSNPRFWVIHCNEHRYLTDPWINKMANVINEDFIYLSSEDLKSFSNGNQKIQYSGFHLFYDGLFDLDDRTAFSKHSENLFEKNGISMRIWEKKQSSTSKFIEELKKIHFPINFTKFDYDIYENEESKTRLLKETLDYRGLFVIRSGNSFLDHLNFIDTIKNFYSNEMEIIESKKIDWKTCKGGLYQICWDNNEINPNMFVKMLVEQSKFFKIDAFKLFEDKEFIAYSCVDLHTGGDFYMEIEPTRVIINLGKEECGNIIFRLFTNLKKYFNANCYLEIDGERKKK